MTSLRSDGYLRARRAIRAFVIAHPRLDLWLGRALVRADVLLRRAGLVRVMAPGTSEFSLRGCTFSFDERNAELAETVVSTGDYEPVTVQAVLDHLRPGAAFADLGANVGVFSVLAARAVGPAGRVYAFEPTPRSAAMLRANLERNGVVRQVTVVEAAGAAEPGRARFATVASSQLNSIAVGDELGGETIDVEVTSLDAFFEKQGWPPLDVVKMDVEGQEIDVFRGMSRLVERNLGLRVVFEYHLGQLGRTGTPGRQLIETARGLGFDAFEVLFRQRTPLDLPADLETLDRMATRANVNILTWRRASS